MRTGNVIKASLCGSLCLALLAGGCGSGKGQGALTPATLPPPPPSSAPMPAQPVQGANPAQPASPAALELPLPSRPRYVEHQGVSAHYGKLIVKPGSFGGSSEHKAWSGFWYPTQGRYTFDTGVPGKLAPLQKYDLYAKNTLKRETHAAEVDSKEPFYRPGQHGGASAGDGLCNAWAAASLLEAEPYKPLTLGGITFEVGDLKTILIKTYEQKNQADGQAFELYGERWEPGPLADYDDIYPDQFHQFVSEQVLKRGKAFMMDRFADDQVWNTPVFEVAGDIEVDSAKPYLLHVKMTTLAASPFVLDLPGGLDFVGWQPQANEYTYDLYAYPKTDGTYEVAYGLWTGGSFEEHPDFVQALPDHGVSHKSFNTEIQSDIVDSILSKAERRWLK